MGRLNKLLQWWLLAGVTTCLVVFALGGVCSPLPAAWAAVANTPDTFDIRQPALRRSQDPAPSLAGPVGSTAGKDVPILMYHYLSDGAPPSIYHVSADLFARQLTALRAYGYQTVSFQDFLAHRAGQSELPAHPVILTFDDGHRSVYDVARPALIAAGMRATLFVTTGFLPASLQDRQGDYWWMVWNPEVQRLYADGFPIEAHSITHPNLTRVSQSEAWQEIWGSRTAIESHLGNRVSIFCYPGGYGAYDAPVRDLVRQAGFEAAVAAWPDGIANTAQSDIWALPRLMIGETNSVDLDQAHPENFFMRKVDPAFMIPLIEVNPVIPRHPNGAPGGCFAPGEAITVTVAAVNRGSPADVWVSLALDDDTDHESVYYRASRRITLATSATVTFNYTPEVLDGRARGIHYVAVDFADDRQVLGYQHTGWQSIYVLADSCHDFFLPVISLSPTYGP